MAEPVNPSEEPRRSVRTVPRGRGVCLGRRRRRCGTTAETAYRGSLDAQEDCCGGGSRRAAGDTHNQLGRTSPSGHDTAAGDVQARCQGRGAGARTGVGARDRQAPDPAHGLCRGHGSDVAGTGARAAAAPHRGSRFRTIRSFRAGRKRWSEVRGDGQRHTPHRPGT
jgi:hypothetical protein